MRLLVPVLLLALAGCAGNVPPTTSYLLRADTYDGAVHSEGPATVGIGTLTIAPYIDRLGLVLEASDGQVNAARHHVWAEPLRYSLRQFLGTAISHTAEIDIEWQPAADPTWKRRLDIRIDQLHGSTNGTAVLVAYWTIRSADNRDIISRHRFDDSQTQTRDGYAAMIEAETELLRRLASSISETLKPATEN